LFSNTNAYLTVACGSSPFLVSYNWSSGFGTKLTDPSALAGAGTKVTFTASETDVAASHFNSPYVSSYPWQPGYGTKYADPSVAVSGDASGVTYITQT
jgi:hypothetical protein